MEVTRMENNAIFTDSMICPNCGSEMVRNGMDNFNSAVSKGYTCYTCNSEEVTNEQIPAEDYLF
jgi:RNA polymerase subunit RPABC4/transcription elongation factor Spt4